MPMVMPIVLFVIVLFTIMAFLWARRAGVDPLAIVSGMFLAAGVILGIHAMSEARGAASAEAQTSVIFAVGLLVSGALLASTTRRSPKA